MTVEKSAQPVRVLFVEHKEVLAGGQVALLALLQESMTQPRREIEPLVLCPPKSGLYARVQPLPLPVYTFDLGRIQKSRNPLLWLWNLGQRLIPTYKQIRLIRREQVDVIYANGLYSFLACVLAAKISRVPIIWWDHTPTQHLARIVRRMGILVRILLALADSIVLVTEKSCEPLIKLAPASAGKIRVIHNGIAIENYCERLEKVESLRNVLGLDKRNPVVGTVGRLAPEKGQRFFLQAAVEVRRTVPGTKFLIVGEGPLRVQLEGLAAQLGLSDDVVFMGFREDVVDLLRVMDVFALPSLDEGFSIALLEAMATGLPIVASSVGGTSETIVDGDNGLVVPAGDSHALAHAIQSLLCDEPRRRRLGAHARASVETNHTSAKMWQSMVELIRSMNA